VGVCEQLGIARSQWSFGVIHNPNMRELDIKQVKETFAQNLGLDMNRCYTTKSKTLTSFACSIAINSTILGKVMNKTLKILRKETTRKIKDDKNFDDFCKGFIIKYILGDGTVSINRTCSNLLMVLSEKDQQSKNDFQRILKAYNITSTVAGIKVSISTSFNAVIFFLENNIFVGHAKNRRKVLEYFTSNYFTNILYTRLKSASEWITIEGFSRRNDINYGAGSQSLIRYRARGYVLSKKDRKRTVFQTTKKGEDFINLVDKINL
jgi:predicted transcriptional regulator